MKLQEYKLSEVTDNFDHLRKPVRGLDRKSGPYPYYGASGIVDYVDDFIFDGEYLLIAEDGENLRTRKTPIAFIATGKYWVNNHVHILCGNEKANTKYLSYALQSLDINGYLTGSTMPKLTKGNMSEIRLKLPEIQFQNLIVDILGTIDNKIENNFQMNETLEKIVETIFKSWFVDFDPVHSKIDGNEPAHMDTKTADLFPTSFDDNGLPQGWKLLDIGSVVEVQKGLSYKGEFLSDTGAKMINLGCFGFRGTFKDEKIKNYVGDYKDRHKIKPGDLIFANTDMTQDRTILCSPVIVPNYIKGIETIFSHHVSHVNIIKSQHPVFLAFLRQFMMTPDFRFRAEGYATGTTVLAVPKNIFDGYYIPIPSNEILDVFYKFISNISKKIETNYIENKTLTKLRDTLLPKLMSGEIRVKDAEREMETAL